jgi:sulfur-oxidizing protein SoxY
MRAVLAAGGLILGFALFGGLVLDYLNVSVHSLSIAGGLLLMLVALEMLRGMDYPEEGGGAEDAALVPIEVKINVPEGDPRRVKAVTLVLDENPAPVVGKLSFEGERRAFALSTRIRVNSYSYLRAIAETEDGRLFMTKAYVKAAGGCSAPANKDLAEAKANLGEIRFRAFADRGEAQVQLRHPNYSGLQMDQVTRLYTPAWYVESVVVRQGDRPLFSLQGSIAISEDPTFRFTYADNGEPVTVEAKDTEGREFRRTFPAPRS